MYTCVCLSVGRSLTDGVDGSGRAAETAGAAPSALVPSHTASLLSLARALGHSHFLGAPGIGPRRAVSMD